MWYSPEKYDKDLKNYNEFCSTLKGELDDNEAKISLIRFLRQNLFFTVYLLAGIKLYPYQEICLKAMLNRNFSMLVMSRGIGKSTMAAIYAFLQCVFEPGTKILIAGPTFRTARNIFTNLEKIVDSRGAELLKQAMGNKPSKRNDLFEWTINEGSITAIPLSNQKVRGFRANVLLLDEYLLIPENIINEVLKPFLIAPQNQKERLDTREMEDELIAAGKMKESERKVFPNNSKMVAFSSASYTFENLYTTYQEYVTKITDNKKTDATYFVAQMSYLSVPSDAIDSTIIEEANSGGASNSAFQREYMAQFTDGSDSYFNAKKMEECTLKPNELPHTLIKGTSGKKYIIGIDPNMSDSPTADYFAMAILELNDDGTGTLVHTYAGLGNLNNHVKYFAYLLTYFNIVFCVIDNAGADIFLDTCNESEIFKQRNLNIKTIDFHPEKDGEEYNAEVRNARQQYNLTDKRIAFSQVFSSEFIRKSNERLQADIDYRRIWFSSRTCANDNFFDSVKNTIIPRELISFGEDDSWTLLDFIENQDDFIAQTKKQCSMVEYSSTSRGNQNFDLPQHLRRGGKTRARKDNYSALLLANWALKAYMDITKEEPQDTMSTFTPFMVGGFAPLQ